MKVTTVCLCLCQILLKISDAYIPNPKAIQPIPRCSSFAIINLSFFPAHVLSLALTGSSNSLKPQLILDLETLRRRHQEIYTFVQKYRRAACLDMIIGLSSPVTLSTDIFSNKNSHNFLANKEVLESISNSDCVQHLKYCALIEFSASLLRVFQVPVERKNSRRCSIVRHAHLRFTLWKLSPWYAEIPSGAGTFPKGVNYNFIPVAAQAYNFTYDLFLHLPRINKLPNGTFMGMMGDIQSGRADALVALSATTERMDVASVGTYAHSIELVFLTRKETSKADWTAFVAPFSLTLWMVILMFAFVTALVGALALLCSNAKHPLYSSLNTAYSAMITASVPIPRGAISAEIVFIAWTFASIIIVHYYNSDLLAKLTIPIAQHTPTSFRELAGRPDYAIGLDFVKGSVSHGFFTSAKNDSYYGRIKDRMHLYQSRIECVRRAILTEKRVCISFNVLLKSALATNFSGLLHSPEYIQSNDQTLSVLGTVLYKKDSKYMEDMDSIVGHVRDCGLFLKWFEQYYDVTKSAALESRAAEGVGGSQKEARLAAKAFDFGVLRAPFFFLVAGLVFSFGIFFLEWSFFNLIMLIGALEKLHPRNLAHWCDWHWYHKDTFVTGMFFIGELQQCESSEQYGLRLKKRGSRNYVWL